MDEKKRRMRTRKCAESFVTVENPIAGETSGGDITRPLRKHRRVFTCRSVTCLGGYSALEGRSVSVSSSFTCVGCPALERTHV